MEIIFEQFAIYGFVVILILTVMYIYIKKQKNESKIVEEKIAIAKADGVHEPVSLYPVVDTNRCIKSGACIKACPEEEILGIRNGKATLINASRCIGHGACMQACPVEAISLWIGTEKRGVDLPDVNPKFETNVSGIYIAGELGGMGLIRNAVAQGKEAVDNLAKTLSKDSKAEYDVIVVGAGPAGISAALEAKQLNLKALILEQDTLGGTIFTFPRSKIVMTHPMHLPLHGKIKLKETNKTELLNLWTEVIAKNNITVKENSKVESISMENNHLMVETIDNQKYSTQKVLLAIGRRGTPRKLNVPGENTEKVAYRLIEPEEINKKNILIVGGGDSAVEAALQLADNNNVTISYRGETFVRLKTKNKTNIETAINNGNVKILFNTNVTSIGKNFISYEFNNSGEILNIDNDLIYIFAGGELPTQFLKKTGIQVNTKHGEVILNHS
jgi:thioredoxin reductase/NAD-dependent dihydropyrimidine dehydrogenase PreA subunit